MRPYYQILRIFYLSQGLLRKECELTEKSQNSLAELNEQRREVQEKCGSYNDDALYKTCVECQGACCQMVYDHFTAIDFWLRRYSSEPIEDFGNEILKPWYLRLIRERFEWNNICPEPEAEVFRTGCPELGDKGCLLPIQDRPIRCVPYTCRAFRNRMKREQKESYAEMIRELHRISYAAFNILKKEGGFPSWYGAVDLAFIF